MEVSEHPMLRRPSRMTSPSKPHNTQKYYEFHEQNGHNTAECWELRKALHELANKDRLTSRFLRKEHEPAWPEPQDKECSTEIVATIAGGYVEGITQFAAPDLLPLARGDAILREALYKICITRLNDRTVELYPINVGDFVLRCTEAVACAGEHGKLTANWEGLYKVEIHQLKISTLSLGAATILHVLDISLEVALQAKGIRCQGHMEFPIKLGALLTSPPLALVLGLG
ncbi:hypothetical protein Cgig2_028312 [Carnegiea gigantea]|uniref:Reverse transcriptase domain-containing protein n=1 Tax=Carnegiea gigantea TaxID=171969 RepID=A0A9Q1GNG8_9CARY|nr:hypothetical protein Cgig2_028312 [Carnegiea gigantea]